MHTHGDVCPRSLYAGADDRQLRVEIFFRLKSGCTHLRNHLYQFLMACTGLLSGQSTLSPTVDRFVFFNKRSKLIIITV